MNTGVLCCRWMQTDICAGGATARRGALFTGRQHCAHCAVRMRTSYSTASDCSTARTAQCAFRGATARRGALLTGHSTVHTAQCAHRGATARRNALQHPSYSQAPARHARRSAHTGELQHGAVRCSTPAMYSARANQGTTGHSRAQSD
jgi:hypothetical protein